MPMTTPGEVRNVAVLGHKGSGKTSLVEAVLYVTKATPKLGRAGDRASGLDESPEEKAHVTTLEARPVGLKWNGVKVNVVDTPGEASFVAAAKLALTACDAALICVSARDGVQTGTERALAWVRERRVPCLIVLTKLDDEHARPDEVVAELKKQLKTSVALMSVPIGVGLAFGGMVEVRSGKAWEKPEAPNAMTPVAVPADSQAKVEQARAQIVDDVAGTDDALTERYLGEGVLTQQELDEGARRAVLDGKLVPVFEVSCTRPTGIVALLDALVDLVPSPDQCRPFPGEGTEEMRGAKADAPPAAFVWKTHIDPHAGKISFVRVVSGTLRSDSNLVIASSGQRERVGSMAQGTWKELKPLSEAVAGEICAVAKLKLAKTCDTLSDEKKVFNVKLPPMPPALYSRTVLVDGKGMEDKAAQALGRICEEDPGLVFKHDPLSREMLLEGLGALHLDITLERLRRKASIECHLGPPRIPYRETIRGRAQNIEGKLKKQTGGHGQFAVCNIDLEPLPRGSGFVFEDAIVGGVIPRQFIPSVEKGIRKVLERGSLAGYLVVDVKVRLIFGKYHDVDSSDAAFQMAGGRAFRAAMAAAQPVLLEPIAKLTVTVPSEYLGDVIGDINSRGGRVTGTDATASGSVIEAQIPLSATLDYEPKLTSITSGRGSFAIGFDHYDYCSPYTTDKVVKDSGFKVDDDED
jgi:elongation factor G